MSKPIISEMFLFNEHDGTSPLLYPHVEKEAVQLYFLAKEKGRDLGAYLVRQSFLLYSIDWNLGQAIGFGRSLIPKEPIPEKDKNKDGTINQFEVMGRNIYPLFTMINSAIFSSHASMNYSIRILGSVFESQWGHSFNDANENEKRKKSIRDIAGNEISDLIMEAWKWEKELKDYRDFIEHYNPFSSQPTVTFTSSNGINYDGFKFFLPSNPEDRQSRGEGQRWGKEAINYAVTIHGKVVQYHKALIPLLMTKYE